MRLFIVKSRTTGEIAYEGPDKMEAKQERNRLNGKKPEQATKDKPLEVLEYYIARGKDHWRYNPNARAFQARTSRKRRDSIPTELFQA